jgi:tetraacyldisaccharide 4'-kinase
LNQEGYRRLVSGASGGLAAAILRCLLGVVAWFYSIVSGLRNFFYSRGWLKTYSANAIVFSIGNITVGGTGKTPLVIWMYNLLRQRNIRCAILTRGYKATHNSKLKTQNYSDEPAILTKSCPEAKVIVNPDRVAGAAEAVDEFSAKVLIMDDGFQHRRLCRDLDIVAIDATCPFGYGKVLPAGLLREPLAGLKRADAVVIARCDQRGEAELSQLEDKLREVNPDMIIARSLHAPVCVKSIGNKEISIGELKNKKIFAFCGIGNPNAFLNTIGGLGCRKQQSYVPIRHNLAGSKIYNDHYQYTNNDIADIYEEAEHLGADLILTTQKDWTKIIADCQSSIVNCQDILWAYLVIELKFIAGEDKLKRLIESALAGKIPRN